MEDGGKTASKGRSVKGKRKTKVSNQQNILDRKLIPDQNQLIEYSGNKFNGKKMPV